VYVLANLWRLLTVALYSEPAGAMVCMFEGQQGGVTQVKFSPDGTKLYSGGRKVRDWLLDYTVKSVIFIGHFNSFNSLVGQSMNLRC